MRAKPHPRTEDIDLKDAASEERNLGTLSEKGRAAINRGRRAVHRESSCTGNKLARRKGGKKRPRIFVHVTRREIIPRKKLRRYPSREFRRFLIFVSLRIDHSVEYYHRELSQDQEPHPFQTNHRFITRNIAMIDHQPNTLFVIEIRD